jgi:NAD+ synthase (glutamine-hydrolysing)
MSDNKADLSTTGIMHDKLVGGIREYMSQHGFSEAILGLSGGIDSAVTCCLAVEAVGAENVKAIYMPSKYSQPESGEFSEILAKNLGIGLEIISITDIYDIYLKVLEKYLGGNETREIDIYHQNLQARIRGNILMAFSNRFGYIVLATGNKSEAMMGYCTLYGDTVGGLAVIGDVFKDGVYRLAGYINRAKEIIPKGIILRAPSAELKPGQKDEDSLPPYHILDGILRAYLEDDLSPEEIKKTGFSPEVVDNVMDTMRITRYKRDQCPPALKVK